MKMKNILIVDDHEIVFAGIKAKLENKFQLYFTNNVEDAKNMAMNTSMNSAILDISIGNENGLDLAYDLKNIIPQIVFFTMHTSPSIIEQIKKQGYAGFFLKEEPFDKIITALENPAMNKFWITETVQALLKKISFDGDGNYDRLTPREQQIFRMIAEGLKPKEISNKINISPKTISVHRENLMHKMNVHSNSDVIHLALKLGIIEL